MFQANATEEKCQIFQNRNDEIYRLCNSKSITCKSNLNSKKDLELFLENTSLKLYKYLCQNEPNTNEVILRSLQNLTTSELQNATGCGFTNNVTEILPLPCEYSEKLLKSIKTWQPFLVLGILCIFGNLIVISKKAKTLWKNTRKSKETTIHSFLILNLAIADLLMGIYLFAISMEIRNYAQDSEYSTSNSVCNTYGIVNMISGQVSLTILVMISYFRLHGLIFPYRRVHKKTAVILIAVSWMWWLLFAIIPILEIATLEEFFTFGASSPFFHKNYYLVFRNVRRFLDSFIGLDIRGNELECVINATQKIKTPSILLGTLQSFDIINFDREQWILKGYYTKQSFCAANLLLKSSSPSSHYTLFIISINLLFCIAIILAYSAILYNVTGRQKLRIFCSYCTKKATYITEQKRDYRRRKEDQKIFYRVGLIVLTDLVAWLTICLLSLDFYFSPRNLCKYLRWFSIIQVFALCAVPLNSVINPYVYSIKDFQSTYLKIRKSLK